MLFANTLKAKPLGMLLNIPLTAPNGIWGSHQASQCACQEAVALNRNLCCQQKLVLRRHLRTGPVGAIKKCVDRTKFSSVSQWCERFVPKMYWHLTSHPWFYSKQAWSYHCRSLRHPSFRSITSTDNGELDWIRNQSLMFDFWKLKLWRGLSPEFLFGNWHIRLLVDFVAAKPRRNHKTKMDGMAVWLRLLFAIW